MKLASLRPTSRRAVALVAAGGLVLAACGGDDGGGAVVVPPPDTVDSGSDDGADSGGETGGGSEAGSGGDGDPSGDGGGGSGSGTPGESEPVTVPIGLTAHLEGFVVEVRSATFSDRLNIDGDPIERVVEIDTQIENLVDQNQRGPSYASLHIGGEQFENELQADFIDALGTADYSYRFFLEPEVPLDDVVLWFRQRDRGNPVAIPLRGDGPTYTLAPIEFEVPTPDPVGDLVFEGSTGRVEFYGEGGRQLAGYAYVILDLTATNTGSDRAEIFRYEVAVEGVGTTPGRDPLRAGGLRLEPGETDEAVRAVQVPIYGDRITLTASTGPTTEPFPFLEFEVQGLADAIPDDVRPIPPD